MVIGAKRERVFTYRTAVMPILFRHFRSPNALGYQWVSSNGQNNISFMLTEVLKNTVSAVGHESHGYKRREEASCPVPSNVYSAVAGLVPYCIMIWPRFRRLLYTFSLTTPQPANKG